MPTYNMFRGDTLQLSLAVVDATKAVVKLAGAKLWMTAKFQVGDADVDAVFQVSTTSGDIIVTDADKGLASVVVPASMTASLTRDVDLFYDIQLRTAAGLVFTIERGTLHVDQDVTRAIA